MSPAEGAPPRALGRSLTALLTEVRDPGRSDWESAWVSLAPAFSEKKSAKLWHRVATAAADEARFFAHKHTLQLEKSLAKAIAGKYRAARARQEPWCLFETCERPEELRGLVFGCPEEGKVCDALRIRITAAPGAFCCHVEPFPLRWLYEPLFVRFLQELLWEVPLDLGLLPTATAGGGEFAISAKSLLPGSLLCDVVADKFNHPELACWTQDTPRAASRGFRATRQRRAAFDRIIKLYWAGAFHPRAIGPLRVENAFLDRGFLPAADPADPIEGLMMKETGVAGPVGSLQEVFQTNFALGRALRLLSHNVHPGGWQKSHPGSHRFRPENLYRHSEAALRCFAINGELDDDFTAELAPERIPEFAAPLEQSFLHAGAAWEHRAQYGRTSAQDFVESVLLEVHRAQYLQQHPCAQPRASLLQDQLLADADETLLRHGGAARLSELQENARKRNLHDSGGRIKSDFIEPETLFWEAWHILPAGERAAIAREVVRSFRERVTEAASCDPRRQAAATEPDTTDPMSWHRHRIHPVLWRAIEEDAARYAERDPVLRELRKFKLQEPLYLSRRPLFDLHRRRGPWEKLPSLTK